MNRVCNFSAGPATLPLDVLAEAQAELLDFKGCGMSIMEVSHRGREYAAVQEEAVANVRKLLALPEEYAVLFMQGGASAQFALVPMNLLGKDHVADYVHTGAWAGKAIQEAQKIGRVQVVANVSKERPLRMPAPEELKLSPGAAYVHITSNETIAGTQWKIFPRTEAPLVADMSSDMLSRPFDMTSFGLVYAGAQKNLGPAGVTLVILRRDLAGRGSADLPAIFRYQTHVEEHSLYNTPPCFAIYVLMLVTRWLLKQGGLEAMARVNSQKAKQLYDAIDASRFYTGSAAAPSRSEMNVTFRLPTEALEDAFVKAASAEGLKGLKGHRSVGGMRASIYNALPMEGVDALVAFMKDFERKHG